MNEAAAVAPVREFTRPDLTGQAAARRATSAMEMADSVTDDH